MRVIPLRYRGRRAPDPVVEFQQVEGEAWFPLAPRLDLANHSPGGHDWGYSGSGPAQLALALLATRLDDADAVELHQRFKSQVIAGLRGDDWEMAGVVVDTFLMAEGAFATAQARHGERGVFFLQAASLGVH